MNQTVFGRIPVELGVPLSALIRNVEDAVADGTWGASEAGSLHLWLRAELMPWAMNELRNHPHPEQLGHLMAQIVDLDSVILVAVGDELVQATRLIERAVHDLADRLIGFRASLSNPI